MAKRWEELGNGRWKLTVTSDTPEDGTPLQVFRGSKEEIADQLADAQGHATKRIAELKRSVRPATPEPNSGNPKPLTANERLQTVAELNNPAQVDKAITRVVESVIGPIENFKQDREEEREERQTRTAIEAAKSFAEQTPDWFPSDHNKNVLVRYMRSQGMSATNREHYTQAFEELSAAELLQPKPQVQNNEPEETAAQPERIAPMQTGPKPPNRISTGIRSADVSGTPPRPTNRLKYSREQIAAMSAGTYKRLMLTDPELARCEDFYAKQPKRRAS